jgi:glucose uptake protein GlcU
MNPSLFTTIALGSAGVLGSIVLIIKVSRNKAQIKFKNIIAGVILGVPNYFAIYLLLLSYRTTGWSASTVLAITNVSVVLCSAIIGFIVFRETKTRKKLIGLLAAISSIIILYFEH